MPVQRDIDEIISLRQLRLLVSPDVHATGNLVWLDLEPDKVERLN